MTDQSEKNSEVAERPRRNLYDGVRGTSVKVLNRVERTDAYLDKLLDTELRSGDLPDVDKGLLTEIVHGVLRWQNKLDWVLNGFSHGNFAKSEINVKNALRVGLYQILFLERIPHAAAVNEAVEFIKRIRGDKPAGLVNAVLRNIIRNMDVIRYPDPAQDRVQYLSVMFSHPHWMVKRWVSRFGADETEKFLIANNERPPLTLRINKLKNEPAMFLRYLDLQQIIYQGSNHTDYFVRVKSFPRIGQNEMFRTGVFTIQDESAALPGLLLAPRPGERVLDLCAAPGGKTTHIAELMKNEGEIIAVDKYEVKLNFIRAACERLGLKNVKPLVGDGSTIELDPCDRVLVDAPCSGLGVLTKKPDLKWKRDISDIVKLKTVQMEILSNAANLVKPGGVLVYSTCSTEPEENQEIVKAFLEKHKDFQLENGANFVSKDLVSADGFVETFPHKHGMDGSFAARMVKRG